MSVWTQEIEDRIVSLGLVQMDMFMVGAENVMEFLEELDRLGDRLGREYATGIAGDAVFVVYARINPDLEPASNSHTGRCDMCNQPIRYTIGLSTTKKVGF